METFSLQTLSAVETSRREMLCKAARTLLDWNRPVEEIMEITGLTEKEIEGLRDPAPDTDTASQ